MGHVNEPFILLSAKFSFNQFAYSKFWLARRQQSNRKWICKRASFKSLHYCAKSSRQPLGDPFHIPPSPFPLSQYKFVNWHSNKFYRHRPQNYSRIVMCLIIVRAMPCHPSAGTDRHKRGCLTITIAVGRCSAKQIQSIFKITDLNPTLLHHT